MYTKNKRQALRIQTARGTSPKDVGAARSIGKPCDLSAWSPSPGRRPRRRAVRSSANPPPRPGAGGLPGPGPSPQELLAQPSQGLITGEAKTRQRRKGRSREKPRRGLLPCSLSVLFSAGRSCLPTSSFRLIWLGPVRSLAPPREALAPPGRGGQSILGKAVWITAARFQAPANQRSSVVFWGNNDRPPTPSLLSCTIAVLRRRRVAFSRYLHIAGTRAGRRAPCLAGAF